MSLGETLPSQRGQLGQPGQLATEVILMGDQRSLGRVLLDGMLQPGSYLEFEGRTYAVLERRHRYQLWCGRYCLRAIALYVQPAQRPEEKSWVAGCWVVGDASCRFNARSELVRCAVNPEGPCEGCGHYVCV